MLRFLALTGLVQGRPACVCSTEGLDSGCRAGRGLSFGNILLHHQVGVFFDHTLPTDIGPNQRGIGY